jgi:hypothetical protein
MTAGIWSKIQTEIPNVCQMRYRYVNPLGIHVRFHCDIQVLICLSVYELENTRSAPTDRILKAL